MPRVAAGHEEARGQARRQVRVGPLRVLKPFKGRISVTADRSRAKSGQRRPRRRRGDGNRRRRDPLHAEGPLGRARARNEKISVTPVKRFGGLPFGGAALGAELAPERAHLRHPRHADHHLGASGSRRGSSGSATRTARASSTCSRRPARGARGRCGSSTSAPELSRDRVPLTSPTRLRRCLSSSRCART